MLCVIYTHILLFVNYMQNIYTLLILHSFTLFIVYYIFIHITKHFIYFLVHFMFKSGFCLYSGIYGNNTIIIFYNVIQSYFAGSKDIFIQKPPFNFWVI